MGFQMRVSEPGPVAVTGYPESPIEVIIEHGIFRGYLGQASGRSEAQPAGARLASPGRGHSPGRSRWQSRRHRAHYVITRRRRMSLPNRWTYSRPVSFQILAAQVKYFVATTWTGYDQPHQIIIYEVNTTEQMS